MEVFINRDLVKETRQAKNWTQQHLAQLCSLSLRTIQRIEKTGVASSESLASLSSSLELPIDNLRVASPPLPQDTTKIEAVANSEKPNQLDATTLTALILIIALAFGHMFLPSDFEGRTFANAIFYFSLVALGYKAHWINKSLLKIALLIPTLLLAADYFGLA
ncbi:MAG: helix-turn-helix domain-containing protein [Psychrobium sp.]